MVMSDKELIEWLYKLYNTLIKEEGHYAKAVTTGLAIDRLEELVATKEALTEQLAAARRDAEEAEAYAGELEKGRDVASIWNEAVDEALDILDDEGWLGESRERIELLKKPLGGKDE